MILSNISKRSFVSPNWSLELAPGWVWELKGSCYSFFNPKGYGVLQISEISQNVLMSFEDMLDWLDLEAEGLQSINMVVKHGDFEGIGTIYGDGENTFWREYVVQKDKISLFITYNCKVLYRKYEEAIVNKMLCSLKLQKPNSI